MKERGEREQRGKERKKVAKEKLRERVEYLKQAIGLRVQITHLTGWMTVCVCACVTTVAINRAHNDPCIPHTA